jgi:hypothetical protein
VLCKLLNHYRASKGCESLTRYVRETSKVCYQELISSGRLDSQMQQLIREYVKHPEGLTDFQASRLLGVDSSTLSARRNDLTKKYGSHLVVKRGIRENGEGRRKGIVWVLNPNILI